VGLSHLCPKNISTAPEKTAALTCKTALSDSSHPITISKNLGFWALHLAGWNEFHFFIFGCWLLPEKFTIYPTQGAAAFSAPTAHASMVIVTCHCTIAKHF